MNHKFSLVVGDKVAYSVKFLTSIGMKHSGMSRAQGVVTEVKEYGAGFIIATIDWAAADMPSSVNVQNLAKIGPNLHYCAA
jgi:hypothetical protein